MENSSDIQIARAFCEAFFADDMPRFMIKNKITPEKLQYLLNALLKEAGLCYAVLDETGTAPAGDVEDAVKTQMAILHLKIATTMLDDAREGNNSGYDNPDVLKLEIRSHFKAAHSSLSAFKGFTLESMDEIDKEIKQVVKTLRGKQKSLSSRHESAALTQESTPDAVAKSENAASTEIEKVADEHTLKARYHIGSVRDYSLGRNDRFVGRF